METRGILELIAKENTKGRDMLCRNVDRAEVESTIVVPVEAHSSLVGRRPVSALVGENVSDGGEDGIIVEVGEIILGEGENLSVAREAREKDIDLRAEAEFSKADVWDFMRLKHCDVALGRKEN